MVKKKSIPHRNRNQTGWWIFSEVEQWVSKRQKVLKAGSKCLVWENMRLVKAGSREEAYRKAIQMCQDVHPSETHGGEWRFAGISMLLPICEDLDDGSEILWRTRGEMTVEKIQKLVKSKKELPVFDDSENEH
jgi:hypothetical protein